MTNAELFRELKEEKSEVKRTDRGWAGHFIGANYCRFRRNTLLEYHDRKWVISTVGGYVDPISGKFDTIGLDRWYETMAFVADDTPYHDADVSRGIDFDSQWGIFAESIDELKQKHPYVDNEADEMHEKVVEELMVKIQKYKQHI